MAHDQYHAKGLLVLTFLYHLALGFLFLLMLRLLDLQCALHQVNAQIVYAELKDKSDELQKVA